MSEHKVEFVDFVMQDREPIELIYSVDGHAVYIPRSMKMYWDEQKKRNELVGQVLNLAEATSGGKKIDEETRGALFAYFKEQSATSPNYEIDVYMDDPPARPVTLGQRPETPHPPKP